MSPLDQVLAAARSLEACGKVPSLALIKTRLGSSLPLPILIQGLQQFKSMPKADRERLAELQTISPTTDTPATNDTLTLAVLAERMQMQQAYFERHAEQQKTEIMQLKNELLELKQRINLLEIQGKTA
ncbi:MULTISPECIES: ELKS/Rab6-interacting/CAST family protein [unclassified Shewanella]|uniref:ELKS/Rab6-interacting/CAST family protein n=1 Tax=Shewanella TaxID=22 RepID=UPI0021D81C7A|nr:MULTISPECIES: ELKS/Rab6-interacting/CAST family protein [unclassified Shewanella]MCU8059658.1 ELKS/Rab6-interacting/CAST family protein [Shewanella sp. SM55]MCU8085891.1 ELKS/Rab6-interacting/CAST family protein [Shewanella sp. SM21]